MGTEKGDVSAGETWRPGGNYEEVLGGDNGGEKALDLLVYAIEDDREGGLDTSKSGPRTARRQEKARTGG
jgi:hypothetical protein